MTEPFAVNTSLITSDSALQVCVGQEGPVLFTRLFVSSELNLEELCETLNVPGLSRWVRFLLGCLLPGHSALVVRCCSEQMGSAFILRELKFKQQQR